MFPDLDPLDGVLIRVINTPRDLAFAQDGWYRVPVLRYPHDLSVQQIVVIGFFLSRAFGARNGSIAYYALRRGVEMALRKDLLPMEAGHPRAEDRYYRVALGALIERNPPIVNAKRRRIGFIWSSWGRFAAAATIADL